MWQAVIRPRPKGISVFGSESFRSTGRGVRMAPYQSAAVTVLSPASRKTASFSWATMEQPNRCRMEWAPPE
jgi:hypothetical protein